MNEYDNIPFNPNPGETPDVSAASADFQDTRPAAAESAVPQPDSLRPRTDPAAPLAASFGKYGLLCLAAGVFYTFCFYKNPSSITWPVFTAAGYLLLYRVLTMLGVSIKKDSWFPAGISVLMSASMCLSANNLLHVFTRLALLLLLAVFLIHQFYDDLSWNIGKYVSAIAVYLCTTVLSFPIPFRHAASYAGGQSKSRTGKTILLAAAGICFSIPFALIIIFMLGDADAVFADIVLHLFEDILNLRTILAVIFESLAASVLFYCILCSRYKRTVPTEMKDRRIGNPVLAISFLSIFVASYLLFCGIQVFYLFLHQGTLPESMTYAEYAHQGFFQLVFVVFVNLALVLCCLKYFRASSVLRLTLTTVSFCTCIMIASAAYRMVLYVSSYRLTFLRILVLWFLAMVAVLMGGIFLLIYRETFPLFRFCLVVVSVFYTAFVLVKPDAVIARYNLTHGGPMNYMDYSYLRSLSADAAPALLRYLPADDVLFESWGGREGYLDSYLKNKIRSSHMAAPNYAEILNNEPQNSDIQNSDPQYESPESQTNRVPVSLRRYNFSEARVIGIHSVLHH